jgi:hypothetical protein
MGGTRFEPVTSARKAGESCLTTTTPELGQGKARTADGRGIPPQPWRQPVLTLRPVRKTPRGERQLLRGEKSLTVGRAPASREH